MGPIRKPSKLEKNYNAMLQRIHRINNRSTETLNNKQLNQLAKYTYECLVYGKTRSYRTLIYDILKPAVGYGDGMFLGLLEFNNQLIDLAGRMKNAKI